MATLIQSEEIIETLANETEALVREKCAASSSLPVPPTASSQAASAKPGHLVLLACALARHATESALESAPSAAVSEARRCLDKTQRWFEGQRSKPSFARLDRRLKRLRKALKKERAQRRAECVRIWHGGGDHQTDLHTYIQASVELLQAMAWLDAVTAVRVAVRMASGRSPNLQKLVDGIGHVQARLLVAELLPDPWVTSRALAFGELMGALQAEHQLDYRRQCWHMSCRAIDALERTAGSTAVDVITDSCLEYLQSGMPEGSLGQGSTLPDWP